MPSTTLSVAAPLYVPQGDLPDLSLPAEEIARLIDELPSDRQEAAYLVHGMIQRLANGDRLRGDLERLWAYIWSADADGGVIELALRVGMQFGFAHEVHARRMEDEVKKRNVESATLAAGDRWAVRKSYLKAARFFIEADLDADCYPTWTHADYAAVIMDDPRFQPPAPDPGMKLNPDHYLTKQGVLTMARNVFKARGLAHRCARPTRR